MIIYVVSAIILVGILINWYLSVKLYEEPKSSEYFNNITKFPGKDRERHINADPRYVFKVSAFIGILIGIYYAYATVKESNFILKIITVILIIICYLLEITKSITLKDGTLVLSQLFCKPKEINTTAITGMYIYSYNKKFFKKNAYTTKLVVSTGNNEKHVFTISSLDNRAVLNLMKDEFGVVNNKIFISKKDNEAGNKKNKK